MWYSSGEFNHNKAAMSQIYESWSLHCSNSMCDAKLSNNFFVKYKSKSWKAGRAEVAGAKVETRWLQLHHINYKNSPGGTKTPRLKPHLAFLYLMLGGWIVFLLFRGC